MNEVPWYFKVLTEDEKQIYDKLSGLEKDNLHYWCNTGILDGLSLKIKIDLSRLFKAESDKLKNDPQYKHRKWSNLYIKE